MAHIPKDSVASSVPVRAKDVLMTRVRLHPNYRVFARAYTFLGRPEIPINYTRVTAYTGVQSMSPWQHPATHLIMPYHNPIELI